MTKISFTKKLLAAAMNAATMVRSPQGGSAIASAIGLSVEDIQRAREALATMPEDVMTTAFDRRDYLVECGWCPSSLSQH